MADDAGLEIDALPGELGPLSKRFEGENTTFEQKMAVILNRMREVSEEKRKARFRCSVAFIDPLPGSRCSPTPVGPGSSTSSLKGEGGAHVFESTCEGCIAHEPHGAGGFGYDPIFWLPELGCSMAELTAAQKHEISHRGAVLRKLAVFLERTYR